MAHSVPAQEEVKVAPQSKSFKGDGSFVPQEINIEPPLTTYEAIKGMPYTLKYFEMEDIRDLINNPKLDFSQVSLKIKAVENFVIGEIKSKNLIDSPKTYNEIIRSLRDKLKISTLEKPSSIFEKIYKFISRARNITAYGK